MRSLVYVIISCLGLSACLTPRVTGQVQSFAEEAAFEDVSSVYITSGSGLTDQSLEFKSYRDLLSAHLLKAGLDTVKAVKDADLIAEFSYIVDEGSTVVETRENPRHFYPYGSYGIGSGGSHRHVGATFNFPLSSSQRTTIQRDVYTRTVSLTLLRTEPHESADPERIYEGKIVSKGSCPLLNQVMPEMLEGLFSNFPNTSGAIEIESDKNCRTSAAK